MATRKSSLALAAFALAASFNCLAADTYKVTANLSHNGKSFGAPVAVVKADTPASVEVSGQNGYKLSFIVTNLAKDEIKIATTLDSAYGTIAPVLVVRPGQPGTVSVGDLELTLTVHRTGS